MPPALYIEEGLLNKRAEAPCSDYISFVNNGRSFQVLWYMVQLDVPWKLPYQIHTDL